MNSRNSCFGEGRKKTPRGEHKPWSKKPKFYEIATPQKHQKTSGKKVFTEVCVTGGGKSYEYQYQNRS